MTTPVIEALLLRWSESHNGRTVTLQLPADGDHPFRGLPCGPANGQRLAIAIALIADDETTHDMPTQAPARPADGGNGKGAGKHRLSQQAALCCMDVRFRTYLEEEHCFGAATPDEAKMALYDICGITSRADLDKDPAAGERWSVLHGKFIGWLHAP